MKNARARAPAREMWLVSKLKSVGAALSKLGPGFTRGAVSPFRYLLAQEQIGPGRATKGATRSRWGFPIQLSIGFEILRNSV